MNRSGADATWRIWKFLMRMQKTKQTFVMTNLSFDFVGTILVLSASVERPLFIVCVRSQNKIIYCGRLAQ